MQLIVEIPDDSPLVQEISAWSDGVAYDLAVRQTGPLKFALEAAGAAEDVENVENNEGDLPAEDAGTSRYSNPAIAGIAGKSTGTGKMP